MIDFKICPFFEEKISLNTESEWAEKCLSEEGGRMEKRETP